MIVGDLVVFDDLGRRPASLSIRSENLARVIAFHDDGLECMITNIETMTVDDIFTDKFHWGAWVEVKDLRVIK